MANQPNNKQVRRNIFVGSKLATGKAEFEARLAAIDTNLAAAIKAGSVHTVDSALYAVRHLESDTTVELMQAADAKKVGITNVNKRQLEANTYMLVTGIQLLEGTADKTDEATLQDVKWSMINDGIANGELEIKNGDKIIFPRNSCEMFRTNAEGNTNGLAGYVALDCPKFLAPLTDVVPTLYLAKSQEGKKAVKLVLYGTKSNKA